jgi:hypothetical protein
MLEQFLQLFVLRQFDDVAGTIAYCHLPLLSDCMFPGIAAPMEPLSPSVPGMKQKLNDPSDPGRQIPLLPALVKTGFGSNTLFSN